jgi:hypothetical protein
MVGLPQIQCRPTPRLWQDAFSPLDIPGLELWLDAYDLNGLGYRGSVATWPDKSGNGRDATQGVGSAQPKVLTWDGENYLHLPGVVGNYASRTYTTRTGNLAIWGQVMMPSASAVNQTLQAVRGAAAAEITFQARINSGRLDLVVSRNGVTSTTEVATSTLGVPVGEGVWFFYLITRDASSGDVVFFTGPTLDSLSQLGDSRSTTAGNLFVQTNELEVGSYGGGAIHAAINPVKSAFIGESLETAFAGVDFLNGTTANNDTVIDSVDGETWTIHRSGNDPACIVSAPVLYSDGVDDIMTIPTVSVGAEFTAFAMVSNTALNVVNYALGGNNEGMHTGGAASGGLGFAAYDGVVSRSAVNGVPALNESAVLVWGPNELRKNGAVPSYISTGNVSGGIDFTRIFCRSDFAAGKFAGHSGAYLIYSRNLTLSEKLRVSEFLGARARAGISIAA